MAEPNSDEFERILAEIEERRTADIAIHHHSLVPALYATVWLHRLVPDGVALGLAALVGHLQWLWPPARRRAIGRMSLMVARTPLEGEVRKLARRQLVNHAVTTEIGMRRWVSRDAPVEGREHLEAALASGRPVIVMLGHLEGASMAILWTIERPVYCIAHPFISPADTRTRAGWGAYKVRLGWRLVRDSPLRLIFRGSAYRALDTILAHGQVVAMALDVPGSSRTTMAGKTAFLGSGLANLARQNDALIVPLTGHLEKRRPSVLIHEPVDPRSYADAQSLLDRLAALLGEEILKAPDRVDPNLYWRAIWREDSAGYGEHLWRRRHPVRAFRRRVRGKLVSVAGQVRQRPAHKRRFSS